MSIVIPEPEIAASWFVIPESGTAPLLFVIAESGTAPLGLSLPNQIQPPFVCHSRRESAFCLFAFPFRSEAEESAFPQPTTKNQQQKHVISTQGGAFAAAAERPLYFAFAVACC
jgi:hypothetical protein